MTSKIAFFALAFALTAAASAQYRIDALIPASGDFTPSGFAGGHLVGNSETETGRVPMIWGSGGFQNLTPPTGFTFTTAAGVNRLGNAVGSGGSGRGVVSGVVWNAGVASVLPSEDGDDDHTETLQSYRALGLNDHGTIFGNAITQYGESTAVVWDGDNVQLLFGFDPRDEYQTSYATAINEAGQVSGSAVSGGKLSAIVWENGQPRILDSSFARSGAEDINDLGIAVGYREDDNGDPAGFVSGPTGTTILPTLTGFVGSDAHSINNAGLIVGDMLPGGFADGVAALWKDGVAYDLNALVGSTDWNLISATGIDDDGSIVGFGTYKGVNATFKVTPVPEPASMIALAGGIAALIRRRKK